MLLTLGISFIKVSTAPVEQLQHRLLGLGVLNCIDPLVVYDPLNVFIYAFSPYNWGWWLIGNWNLMKICAVSHINVCNVLNRFLDSRSQLIKHWVNLPFVLLCESDIDCDVFETKIFESFENSTINFIVRSQVVERLDVRHFSIGVNLRLLIGLLGNTITL